MLFKSVKKMNVTKVVIATMIVALPISIKYLPMTLASDRQTAYQLKNSLLSDPFLQLPTKSTVNVVWFTEFTGDEHWVEYGSQLQQRVKASTTKLSQVREDKDSQIDNFSTQTVA